MNKDKFIIAVPKRYARGLLYPLIALSMMDHAITLATGMDGDARAFAEARRERSFRGLSSLHKSLCYCGKGKGAEVTRSAP
jgi:hypothetical protein